MIVTTATEPCPALSAVHSLLPRVSIPPPPLIPPSSSPPPHLLGTLLRIPLPMALPCSLHLPLRPRPLCRSHSALHSLQLGPSLALQRPPGQLLAVLGGRFCGAAALGTPQLGEDRGAGDTRTSPAMRAASFPNCSAIRLTSQVSESCDGVISSRCSGKQAGNPSNGFYT